MTFKRWFHRFGSSPYVYGLAGRFSPWLAGIAVVTLAIGVYGGLLLAPPDYLQGDSFRILYIHFPSVAVGMLGYTLMAVAAGIGFVWRLKIGHAAAVAIAPLGASFMALGLITGAIWGRPTWGTYWEWGDARLMSSLLLVFLYLGYMALRAAFEERDKADRVGAVLAVVGVVNVPIIHYSVEWWNTLHQGATVTQVTVGEQPTITADMLWPLIFTFVGFVCLFGWMVLNRLRGEIVERERDTRWLRERLAGGAT
jgi:heme exporter protein C